MKPTEPTFLRDPGSLITRCICPGDGTWMHVTGQGFWECDGGLHRWQRQGRGWGKPGAWKLLKTRVSRLPLKVRYA